MMDIWTLFAYLMGAVFTVTMVAFTISILLRLGHRVIKGVNPELARKIEMF